MTKWPIPAEVWPDWGDDGRRVEIRLDDGATVVGTLEQVDETPGPDEAPLFDVVADDGRRVALVESAEWRWAPTA